NAGSVRSQAARILKSRGERALCSIGSDLKNRAADSVQHKQIARPVKGQPAEISKLGNDERAPCPFRCEFENRITLRNKEITRTIKGHSLRADPPGERTSLSVGREFENRALRVVHDEKIPFTIKAQTTWVQPRGEGALCAIGRVFEDGMSVAQKEISGCINSQRARLGANGN